jgi:hypothetical protein
MRFLKWLIPILILGALVYAVFGGKNPSYRSWIVNESRPKPTMNPGDLRIRVVNASEPGAGSAVSEYLSRQGFDVDGDTNYYEIIPRTRIIDRRDPQMKYAREIQNVVFVPARKLGPFTIHPRVQPEIGCEIDSLLYLECTVLLGSDYQTFFPVSPRHW